MTSAKHVKDSPVHVLPGVDSPENHYSLRGNYNGSPQGADGSSRQAEHMVEIVNPGWSGSVSQHGVGKTS
jgi:hypothetical protein